MSDRKRYRESDANSLLADSAAKRAADSADWQKLVSRSIKRTGGKVTKKPSAIGKLVRMLTGK